MYVHLCKFHMCYVFWMCTYKGVEVDLLLCICRGMRREIEERWRQRIRYFLYVVKGKYSYMIENRKLFLGIFKCIYVAQPDGYGGIAVYDISKLLIAEYCFVYVNICYSYFWKKYKGLFFRNVRINKELNEYAFELTRIYKWMICHFIIRLLCIPPHIILINDCFVHSYIPEMKRN